MVDHLGKPDNATDTGFGATRREPGESGALRRCLLLVGGIARALHCIPIPRVRDSRLNENRPLDQTLSSLWFIVALVDSATVRGFV